MSIFIPPSFLAKQPKDIFRYSGVQGVFSILYQHKTFIACMEEVYEMMQMRLICSATIALVDLLFLSCHWALGFFCNAVLVVRETIFSDGVTQNANR